METTYVATFDILDGMHKTTNSIRETSSGAYNDDQILHYFEQQGKLRYGDKYVQVARIEKQTGHLQLVVIYNSLQAH